MEISSQEVVNHARKKFQLYNVLSKLYYLPEFNSKAVTREYLIYYTVPLIPIFVMKKEEVTRHHFPFRKHTSAELLEFLDKILSQQNLPPTGLTVLSLPDQEWLRNAILHVDPSDPYKLLATNKEKEEPFTLEVNEE